MKDGITDKWGVIKFPEPHKCQIPEEIHTLLYPDEEAQGDTSGHPGSECDGDAVVNYLFGFTYQEPALMEFQSLNMCPLDEKNHVDNKEILRAVQYSLHHEVAGQPLERVIETKYEPPFQYVNGMFNRRVMDSNPRTDYHWKADVANSDDSAIIYRFGATDNPLGINFRDAAKKKIPEIFDQVVAGAPYDEGTMEAYNAKAIYESGNPYQLAVMGPYRMHLAGIYDKREVAKAKSEHPKHIDEDEDDYKHRITKKTDKNRFFMRFALIPEDGECMLGTDDAADDSVEQKSSLLRGETKSHRVGNKHKTIIAEEGEEEKEGQEEEEIVLDTIVMPKLPPIPENILSTIPKKMAALVTKKIEEYNADKEGRTYNSEAQLGGGLG